MKSNITKIRNFCIIAHIDHGKSTLADRLIEITGTLAKREIKDRVMDTLELEQERGITIKLQTARLKWKYTGKNPNFEGEYILNLIDTPGHVDFSYEVSRSVAASEGALLLVDSTQGIQAQTLSTIYKAMEYDLKIISVLNKIDLPNAEIERVSEEITSTFGFKKEEIVHASGKTGIGAEEILNKIIEEVPHPQKENSLIYFPTLDSTETDKLSVKALIFDAFYHEYKGVVALIKLVSGNLKFGDKLYSVQTQTEINPIEFGYLNPSMLVSNNLLEGEVGYIATGLKNISEIHTGDTITLLDKSTNEVTSLLGYQAPTPMVYASLYPVDSADFSEFSEALQKLALNDSSLSFQKENSPALGTGYLCGFLGLLHLEITQERLDKEFNISLISTTPTVEFRIKLATKDYSKLTTVNSSQIDPISNTAVIRTAYEFPDNSLVNQILEPWVKMEIICPETYVGAVMELAQKNRGIYKSLNYINKNANGPKHAILSYELPTIEIITSFFDKLKSVTHGFASMDYELVGYRQSEIVKVNVLLNGEEVDALSFLTHKSNAMRKAKDLAEKLKDIIPRQNFKIPIQCAIGNTVIARETIQAYRKDVLAKLYGGDETRKKKLLEKQKKGKKRMKMFGKVEVPKEAFLAILKTD